jgi:hypothetical protein
MTGPARPRTRPRRQEHRGSPPMVDDIERRVLDLLAELGAQSATR